MKRGTSGINALLAIDKPSGITSHDVVSHVRRALSERRVGHAGTLDPAASGVMVVGVGQATRLLGLLTADTKSYIATIVFGSQTSTDDAEGEIVRACPVPREATDATWAQGALNQLSNTKEQIPPAYSAISVDGKRSYARARAGEVVELAARPITVYTAQLLSAYTDDAEHVCWDVAFSVSKGTYIRALARDLGQQIGSAAHLGALRRSQSGLVSLRDCLTLDQIDTLSVDEIPESCLDPLSALALPYRELDEAETLEASQGRPLHMGNILSQVQGQSKPQLYSLEPEQRVALVSGKALVGVWQRRGSQLRSEVNIPNGVRGVSILWL